jgi:hypothetical protein
MYNINYSIIPNLANRITSKIGQLSIFESKSYNDKFSREKILVSLASNPYLDSEVWAKLANKPKAEVAYGLIDRKLSIEQIKYFKKEKRITVLKELFSKGLKNCNDEMAEFIFQSNLLTKELARLWIKNGKVPDSYKKKVGLLENGSGLLIFMKDKNLFSAEEIIEILPNIDFNRVRFNLYALFDYRPDLVTKLSDNIINHKRLLDALSSSRHLFDFEVFKNIIQLVENDSIRNYERDDILYSLLGNPNTPNEVLLKTLELLGPLRMDSTCRYRYASNSLIINHAKVRVKNDNQFSKLPWENYIPINESPYKVATYLLGYNRYPTLRVIPKQEKIDSFVHNKNESEEIALDHIIKDLKSGSVINKETLNYITEQLDNSGKESWELFWTLFESWEDDLNSLLNFSINLNKAPI